MATKKKIKPTLTAAEKRVYLAAFGASVINHDSCPAMRAYHAVMIFRESGKTLKSFNFKNTESLDMWEEVSTVALGL